MECQRDSILYQYVNQGANGCLKVLTFNRMYMRNESDFAQSKTRIPHMNKANQGDMRLNLSMLV